jgi:hypothetical protein
MENNIELLLKLISKEQPWDDKPVFCFTSDIDWASEDVMSLYFEIVNDLDIKPTLFCTHHSDIIQANFEDRKIERGIHPNFLEGSSHGNSFKEIVETCMKFAPESYGFRSHRLFDVTDITHMLKNDYGYKYVSNLGTVLQQNIRPILHESGLIHFPIFFEDGTHLYNKLDLDFRKYIDYFTHPGIKIISFHPMNFVFNTHEISYMRQIKDSLTREDFNNISFKVIDRLKNRGVGIQKIILDIVKFVKSNNYPIFSLNELYQTIIKNESVRK